MLRKLREIVDELLHQRLRGAVIGGLVGPSIPGIADRAVDARNRDRKFEAEIRVLSEFGVIDATVERRVEQPQGRLDRHPADAVHRGPAAGPAGVYEPAMDAALRDDVFPARDP